MVEGEQTTANATAGPSTPFDAKAHQTPLRMTPRGWNEFTGHHYWGGREVGSSPVGWGGGRCWVLMRRPLQDSATTMLLAGLRGSKRTWTGRSTRTWRTCSGR